MKKYWVIGLLGYWFIGLFPSSVGAAMSNDNYLLENKDTEIQPFRVPTPKPVQKQSQEKPLATGKNFITNTNLPLSFSFSISHERLNFGELTATNPVIRLFYLTTSSSSPYQIFVNENHPLMQGKIPIPDTTCDNGSCTEITSSLWASSLTYGFGYNTQNMPENHYMQFPDLSKNEPFEAIFAGQKGNNIQKQVIYKVNIAGTQQPGGYSNVVTYLATPSY